jgi:hypothetical protein
MFEGGNSLWTQTILWFLMPNTVFRTLLIVEPNYLIECNFKQKLYILKNNER